MTVDNGVRITRYSSATPSVSTDDALREGRIDGGGRLYVRNADDRDLSPRYFRDGEAVDAIPANDRGFIVLGKEDGADVYRVLRLDDIFSFMFCD